MSGMVIRLLPKAVHLVFLSALLTGAVPGSVTAVLAAPGDFTRLSVSSGGGQADGRSFGPAETSLDGRFTVFLAEAENLVTGDTNGMEDIFVRDQQAGLTTRASVDSAGLQANDNSESPDISTDGRFVVFASAATNLVTGDFNGVTDIFIHDRQTGATSRVSVDSAGLEANGASDGPSVSSDGRFVAFSSPATNLVPGDTNGVADLFVRDRQSGTTERISVSGSGEQANDASGGASISNDGNKVMFTSRATNLAAGDTNGSLDVFVRDRAAGTTNAASISSNGIFGSRGASDAKISGNGRYVVFTSASSNLIDMEPNAETALYVRDLQAGATKLISHYTDGYEMAGESDGAAISDDGRYVVFEFDEAGDSLPLREIYAHDNQTGMTMSVTGFPGNDHGSFLPAISGNGLVATLLSGATYFVSGDTNLAADVFGRQISFGPDLNPAVDEISVGCGFACTYPSPALVSFRVTFSEIVTGVDVSDFNLTLGGDLTGASVVSVTGTSGLGNVYFVNVNTGTNDGTLRLDVVDDDTIRDVSSNPLGGPGAGNGGFTTAPVFIVDKSSPSATAITRLDPNPSAAGSVRFTAAFSEPVTGVDAGDFTLAVTGAISGSAITTVEGSGTSYTISVSTGTGDGTLQLNLMDNDSIQDAISQPLGGAGVANGDFTTGEAYTINRNPPSVTSSLRADLNPTAADSVRFTVTFSESVSGVDAADFTLTVTGVTGASVTGITGADNIYIVTAGTGTGNGTIRLDVVDNDSILDGSGIPLGGGGAGNGSFTAGEAYTVDKTPVTILSTSIRSNGANDGWILESSEDSGQGGSVNAKAATFNLGDDSQDRQYRALLHFPTSYLPDNAVVTQVILMIKRQGGVGADPYTTHQAIRIDIRNGFFGSSGFFGINSLEPGDFQAPASMESAGTILNNPVGGWYWSLLNPTSYSFVNLQGVTQIRLMFQTDDNDDLDNDYLTFFSGNHGQIGDRPHLLIEYYIRR
jgi:hypothetical protein